MDVSIIIVSYNTKELTLNCIKSIYKNVKNINFDIFLVDNASVDNTVSEVKINYPNVKVIKNNTNIGFGAANNLAIKKSDSKYVFLLNSDTILINNVVKLFYNFMENSHNKKIACCGGILTDKFNKVIHHYGYFPNIARLLLGSKIYGFFYDKFAHKNIPNNIDYKFVDYVTGADLFIKMEVIDEVGMFDESFFLYYEETDLQYRFKNKGFFSAILNNTSIIHLKGSSQKTYKKIISINNGCFNYFKKNKSKFSLYLAILIKLTQLFFCLFNFKNFNIYRKSLVGTILLIKYLNKN